MRIHRRRWGVIAAALACIACDRTSTSIEASSPSEASGAFVIIGGRLEPDNQALFMAMLRLRAGSGPICVIPTASAEPGSSMAAYTDDFRRYGGPEAAVGLAIHAGDLDAVADPALADRLHGCSGFFFTGGDQSRIVDTFKPAGQPSLAFEAITARHRAGAFVAGTSAGAAMISDPMIGGGDSTLALAHGVCDFDGCEGVWVRDGMGFWPGWVTDQHFLVRGRAGRLLVVLLGVEGGPRRGLGVDEDTGVIVHGETAEVVGRSGALRIDASAAALDDGTWTGITLHLYGPGDRFDLADGRLLAAGAPARVADPAAPAPERPSAAFESGAFTELLLALAEPASPSPLTLETQGYRLRVSKGSRFWAGARVGPERVGSAGPFVVELRLASP